MASKTFSTVGSGPQQQPPMYIQQPKPVAPGKKGCISLEDKKYYRAHTIMGSLQIVCGLLFIIATPVMIWRSPLRLLGGGFAICGITFVIAGALGIGGRKKKLGLLIASMVFCILAAVMCSAVLFNCGARGRMIRNGPPGPPRGPPGARKGPQQMPMKKEGGKFGFEDMRDDDGKLDGALAKWDDIDEKWFGGKQDEKDEEKLDRMREDKELDDEKSRKGLGKLFGKGKREDMRRKFMNERRHRRYLHGLMALHFFLSFIALFEMVVAIVQAAYCGRFACCNSGVKNVSTVYMYRDPAVNTTSPDQLPAYSVAVMSADEKKALEAAQGENEASYNYSRLNESNS